MTCAKGSGKPRWNADNRPFSVDILWRQRKPENNARGSCAIPRRGSKNASTVRNGHCPGGNSGTWEEQGNLSLTRVPGSGGRRVRAGKARQLADPMRRGQARSPASHTWRGPCLILPGTNAQARTDTPAGIRTRTAGIPGVPCAGGAPRPTRPRCRPTRTRTRSSPSGRPPRNSQSLSERWPPAGVAAGQTGQVSLR
jgi:hypothetical protein